MHVLYKSESHFLGSIYYYYYFFFDMFERRSKNKNEFIYFIPIEKHMFTFPHMDFVKNTNLLLLLRLFVLCCGLFSFVSSCIIYVLQYRLTSLVIIFSIYKHFFPLCSLSMTILCSQLC